jgi:hypothetical protein
MLLTTDRKNWCCAYSCRFGPGLEALKNSAFQIYQSKARAQPVLT